MKLDMPRLEFGRCGNEPRLPFRIHADLQPLLSGTLDERAITALTEALNEESSDLRADAAMALSKLTAGSPLSIADQRISRRR